jgi:multidrug efflux pump subunit AcrB
VQFIESGRARGLAPEAAAIASAVARFRPIFITSVTTIAGLTPLLLERSTQAQVLIPLATSLAFGLAVATLIALFLVPACYCMLQDFGWLDDTPASLPDAADQAAEPVSATGM